MAQRKRGGTFQKRGGIGGKDKSEEASASSASIVATGLLTQGYCYITYNGHYTVDILHGLLWFPDLWILIYCVQ